MSFPFGVRSGSVAQSVNWCGSRRKKASCTLKVDAVSATLSDAVCAYREYGGLSVYVCRGGAGEVKAGGEERVGVLC